MQDAPRAAAAAADTTPPPLLFNSRRSPVLCRHGAVASSQMQASRVGWDILHVHGGNAVDACIAMAAALNVTEPCSTGLGGDCFAIVYDAKTKQVHGLNGSGRAPAALTLDVVAPHAQANAQATNARASGLNPSSVHAVTVPGAAAGWVDALAKWGRLSLAQVLQPAIQLAEEGLAVEPITAHSWKQQVKLLQRDAGGAQLLNANGEAPAAGEIFRNPALAETFRRLAAHGKDGFYDGPTAGAILDVVRRNGGVHDANDLRSHVSTFPDPVHVRYRGVDVWELPPNGQGLTALLALNLLRHVEPELGTRHAHNSASHLHTLIECMRLAFADTRWYIADPDHQRVPIEELLSDRYAAERAKLFRADRASPDVQRGAPVLTCDTVSFCAVDAEGNACSFINSNYMGFGSGLVPDGCGFSLQNRGANFSLDPAHPNVLAPNKRPYHTIIPGMATKDGELFGPFSVMGGFMQPQGHVQVLVNMLDYGMDAQRALDMPRFCIESGEAGGHVLLEDGIDESVVHELRRRGHDVRVVTGWARSVFGRGQIIRKAPNGVLWAGSDGRGDGQAMGR